MHYFVAVIVPGDTEDIKGKVKEMMEPFNENKKVDPYKAYLSERDIARMSEHYETTNLQELAGYMDDWDGDEGGVDEKGLYRVRTYNPQGKWDYYEIGGRWDGDTRNLNNRPQTLDEAFNREYTLEDNMLPLKILDHDLRPYAVLTPDGIWHSKQTWPEFDRMWEEERGPWNEEQDRPALTAWIEEEDQRWQSEYIQYFQQHQSAIIVGVDIHS